MLASELTEVVGQVLDGVLPMTVLVIFPKVLNKVSLPSIDTACPFSCQRIKSLKELRFQDLNY
jgi:hypothetical protein